MKIAFEAQRILRPKKHGMDIVALEILKELDRHPGNDHIYVYAQKDKDNQTIKDTNKTFLRAAGPSAYPLWEQFYLPDAVRKDKADILHCTNNTAPVKPKTPLIVTIHDVIYMEKLSLRLGTWYQRIGNFYRRWNVPLIADKASLILTVSNYEREKIIRLLNISPEKVRTVYNSYGEHFSSERDPERLEQFRIDNGLPENFILFLGNTDPKKNLKNVLKALGILHRKGMLTFKLVMPDLDLNHLKSILKEQNNEAIADKIILTGYIPNKELPNLYKLAKLFLYPSLRESFGIPILEAMACGTPVITSNTSAMPEIAGENALLIDPENATQLADKIIEVLQNPGLQKELIEYGMERSKLFSWNKTANQVYNCYCEVLSK